MTDYASEFNTKRIVYIPNALDIDTVNKLNDEIHSLTIEGKGMSDDQCPKSHSFYNPPKCKQALSKMVGPLSKLLNIDLDYSYCYARLYLPGEVLKPHIDRESCEISATMTLGYHGPDVWPIYMGNHSEDTKGNKINIGIGDMLMYRGTELRHWREKFQGVWQTQLFFHFVDKNGPYIEHAQDRKVVVIGGDSIEIDGEDYRQKWNQLTKSRTSTPNN